jgi:mono/diheme cytochrome c family protein
MRLGRLVKWSAVWGAGVATTGALGLGVIYTGAFDATASRPHEPVVAWATHTAFVHSVRLRARAVHAPARFTRPQILAGLADYDRTCSGCHGGPAAGRAPWASGMNPTPPSLLDAARRWTPAELYWIVREGVKMTGMPAWGGSRSDPQVWNIVAFLEAVPSIPPADYARLRRAGGQSPGNPIAATAVQGRLPSMLVLTKKRGPMEVIGPRR